MIGKLSALFVVVAISEIGSGSVLVPIVCVVEAMVVVVLFGTAFVWCSGACGPLCDSVCSLSDNKHCEFDSFCWSGTPQGSPCRPLGKLGPPRRAPELGNRLFEDELPPAQLWESWWAGNRRSPPVVCQDGCELAPARCCLANAANLGTKCQFEVVMIQ